MVFSVSITKYIHLNNVLIRIVCFLFIGHAPPLLQDSTSLIFYRSTISINILQGKKNRAKLKVNIHRAPMLAARNPPLHTPSHACYYQTHQETDTCSEEKCPESDQHQEANL